MKKIYCLLFLFVVCFSFMGDVLADTSEVCFYSDTIWDTADHVGTEKGTHTFATAIKYTCDDSGKCKATYAAGYTDKNQDSKTISFKNASDYFGGNVSHGKSYFYDSSKKKIKCPSYIVVRGNITDGINFSYTCPSGEASSGRCIGNDTKIPKSSSVPSGDTLAAKVKSVTDDGRYNSNQAANTPATEAKKEEDDTKNQDLVDKVRTRAEKENDEVSAKSKIDELSGDVECTSLLGEGDDSMAPILKNVFLVICVLGVIVLVVTLVGDFIKAITSGENDAIAKAFRSAKIRIIATLILLLLPAFVNFVIDVVNDNTIVIIDNENNKTEVKIGKVSDCQITD